MGLFTKKERVHFERDEAGKVVRVIRNGVEEEPGQRSTEQLEREYYREHPTRGMVRKQRRLEEKEAYQRAYQEARVKRMTKEGRRMGGMTWGDRLDRFSQGFSVPSGRRYKTSGNYNPFGSLFDTGMTGMRRSRKPRGGGSKTKYVVKGGKAYPVAGTGKKKKKKSKGRGVGGGRGAFGFDYGSWGW